MKEGRKEERKENWYLAHKNVHTKPCVFTVLGSQSYMCPRTSSITYIATCCFIKRVHFSLSAHVLILFILLYLESWLGVRSTIIMNVIITIFFFFIKELTLLNSSFLLIEAEIRWPTVAQNQYCIFLTTNHALCAFCVPMKKRPWIVCRITGVWRLAWDSASFISVWHCQSWRCT